MEIDSTHASKRTLGALWAIAALVVASALGVIVMRPWDTSATAQNHDAVQSAERPATVTVSVPVEGMSCMVCASSVKRSAEGIDGVTGAEVDLAGARAKVSYVEGKTSPERIAAEIARLGYKTGPPVVENGR